MIDADTARVTMIERGGLEPLEPYPGVRAAGAAATRELPRISLLLAGAAGRELMLRAWGIVAFSRHGNMPCLVLPAVSGEAFLVVFTEAGRAWASGVPIVRMPPGTW